MCNRLPSLRAFLGGTNGSRIGPHMLLYTRSKDFMRNPDRGLFIVMLIAWFEVALGRIAPFLAWHHFAKILLPQVDKLGHDTKNQHEQLQVQDGCLACLLLKVSARGSAGTSGPRRRIRPGRDFYESCSASSCLWRDAAHPRTNCLMQ